MTADEAGPRDGSAPPWDYGRLARLAAQRGTPMHVLDTARVDNASRRLTAALDSLDRPAKAYYSVKTNYLPFLCRRLAHHGFGADVVSGYEMAAALRAGFRATDMVFNGPVKTEPELAAAVEHNVRVNIDGEHEVDMLDVLAGRHGRIVEVGVRISPGRPLSRSVDPTYRMLTERAAVRSRFGWPAGSDQLRRVVSRIREAKNLRLTAVHTHLGSQIVHQDLMLAAITVVLEEAADLHRRTPLVEVNIGGGFGVPGIRRSRRGPLTTLWALHDPGSPTDSDPCVDVARLLADVDVRMTDLELDGVRLACEPGRWLVSESMSLLTSVASLKRLPEADWLILDAGNNMAPWTGSGEAHRLVPIGRTFASETVAWSVSGPLCFEQDVHATEVELPADVGLGDVLCVHDTGAYSVGRSSNFIRTRGEVVALDGADDRVVWAAESDDDVFRPADPTSSTLVAQQP